MSNNSKLRKARNQYIINKVRDLSIPEFKPYDEVRILCLFSGRLQHRGLRLETEHLVHRLKLTGFINNKPSGEIELEIQGPENKANYLIEHILNIKRISIKEHKQEVIPIDPKESTFELI
ncbi:MAG: acylphosphatase [Erysipelotrichaceae bacterium]|nr:acylphosphatase [Erysipelotrichaceae bacterium]